LRSRVCAGALSLVLVGAVASSAAGGGTPAFAGRMLRIEATANLWGAGHESPPNSGSLPPGIKLYVLPGGFIEFRVSGMWHFGLRVVRPDGLSVDGLFGGPAEALATEGISGIKDGRQFWYLGGVFLDDSEPEGEAPPTLTFTNHDFTNLAPMLRQTFFIGNGQTSAGKVQRFRVPPGATRLFLGMPDICGSPAEPDCYYDNSGALAVTVLGR
jgi:hypothetical protein